MAAYPFTTFSEGSIAEPQDGRLLVRASNGALKTRVMFSGDKKAYTLLHWFGTGSKSTLDSFYGTNRLLSWTLVFDGGTSTCVFAAPPKYEPLPGSLYNVTVTAEEV
jgi:hypothetical protein